jgi:hypothetical protein
MVARQIEFITFDAVGGQVNFGIDETAHPLWRKHFVKSEIVTSQAVFSWKADPALHEAAVVPLVLGPSVEHLLLVMCVDASDLYFALDTDVGNKLDLARVGLHLESDQRLQNQQESNVESPSDLPEKLARRHDSEQEAGQCV